MSDEEKPDEVRDMLMKRAASCLDHIRCVAWGKATSGYMIKDGEKEIHVNIEVQCFRKWPDEKKT